MATILNLETSTTVCSVVIAEDKEILACVEQEFDKYQHSQKLLGFIESALKEANLKMKDLDAIAVSEGPGSYTGLRIGTSTAKGFCYALNKPLIAVNSLAAISRLHADFDGLVCPMIDARRMEVFTAVFKGESMQTATEAKIIDTSSFVDLLANDSILFVGPGAEKCQGVIQHENANFDIETMVSAKGMVPISLEKFQSNNFVDVAYFEPSYFKEFKADKPKKLL